MFFALTPSEQVCAGEKSKEYKGLAVSSIDKIALKLKNSEKYYKAASRIVKEKDNSDDGNKNESENGSKDVSGEENNISSSDGSGWNENYSEEDLRLMSSIIYCEAGSMGEPARIAVANVIINRAKDNKNWGHVSTVYEVIYDQKWGVQFSPITGNPSSLDKAMEIYDNLEDYKGNWKYDQMKNCISSAKKAFSGEKSIPDSFMYFNGSIESSKEKCEEGGRDYIIYDHHIYFE